MNTALKPMYEWKDINWRKAERCVFKLQKRIFKSSQRGDVKLVHKLQRLILKSWYAKLIAVRRVSQDNQGKKTAGVDGIKSLTPKQRMALAKNIRLGNKSKPTPQVVLIKRLNPIIRGWSNYYSSVVSSKTFTDCHYYFFEKLKRWAYRRHPMKNRTWIMRKYWHTEGKDNWVFSTREGKNFSTLARHLDTKVVRYIKVRGNKSP